MSQKRSMNLEKSVTNWSKAILIKRGLWTFIFQPLSFIPFPVRAYKVWLLRLFGAQIADRCVVRRNVRVLMPWNLSMGEWTTLGDNVNVYNFGKVTIGKQVIVSQNVYLCTGTHDYKKPHFPLIWGDITIHDSAWVAADAFVGPNVVIGEGAVVGARAVVNKNMPEWMVCAGNPCVPLKPRILEED